MSFQDFLNEALNNNILVIISLLIIASIFVNGSTDAPNSIATSIASNAVSMKNAIRIAVVFNFLGIFVMTYFSREVAITIYNLVDFSSDARLSLITLCASTIAIVVWASIAWIFGIPTSESHALIAGLSGAFVALASGFSGLNFYELKKVFYGLVLSIIMGFVLGYLICSLIAKIITRIDNKNTDSFFKKAQLVGCAQMAFMHGAQDGQKFIGVFLLGISLSQGNNVDNTIVPLWLMITTAVVMALGTAVGGKKIIKIVAFDMVTINPYQGFASDVASSISLFVSTIFGFPVSTTHVKLTSIMGVAYQKDKSSLDFKIVKNMFLTWILTFPGCGVLAYIITKILIM